MKLAPYFTTIWVTTEFSGLHRYPEAPEEVAWLRYPHRHLFKVRVELHVSNDNRDQEFFIVQGVLDHYVKEKLSVQSTDETCPTTSCETMAQRIAQYMLGNAYNVRSVEVSEDGENGAKVHMLGTLHTARELTYRDASAQSTAVVSADVDK